MRIFLLMVISIVFFSMAEHAGKYPVNEFHSPVNRDIKLSGTFGELRSNHFHAGLDIKSLQGTSGDPIYAANEGYISRIRVEEFGYGNALYVEHPNGFTSLYAHLDRFSPEIEAYVKNEQYKAETFELDIHPEPSLFPVQKAQQIGNMGNTGYSFGPHLHFEIRHTEGQIPVNPLHFGFPLADKKSPVFQQLIAYEFNEKGQMIQSTVLQPNTISSGKYIFDAPIKVATQSVSFAIRAYDAHDGTSNQNGIYSVQCKVDEDPSFAFAFDEIPFDQARYLNAHIDYPRKIYENKFFHRCHPLEGNRLPIYYTGVDKGMIYLNTEQPREIRLDVADFNGNVSSLSFEVIRDRNMHLKAPVTPAFQIMANPEEVCVLSKPGIQVVWPKGSFYEKTPLAIDVMPSEGLGIYSSHFAISPTDVPVHYYFDVNIEGLGVPPHLREKAFIARCEADGSIVNCGATWIGNNLSTGVRQLSTYTIMTDTIAPSVSTLHFGPKMTGWTRMAFKISDNFRIRDRGRDLLYDAWVDGQWVLMSHDGKNSILTHTFDGRIAPGEHQLIIKVTDDRGNQGVLEKSFTL